MSKKTFVAVTVIAQNVMNNPDPTSNPNPLTVKVHGQMFDVIVEGNEQATDDDMQVQLNQTALDNARQYFPPEQGWKEHQIFFHPIDPERIQEYLQA